MSSSSLSDEMSHECLQTILGIDSNQPFQFPARRSSLRINMAHLDGVEQRSLLLSGLTELNFTS